MSVSLSNTDRIAILTKVAGARERKKKFNAKWKILNKGSAKKGGRFRGVGVQSILNKKTGEIGLWVRTHRARGEWRKSMADVPNSEIRRIRSTG